MIHHIVNLKRAADLKLDAWGHSYRGWNSGKGRVIRHSFAQLLVMLSFCHTAPNSMWCEDGRDARYLVRCEPSKREVVADD